MPACSIAAQRRQLALAMFEQVLTTLAAMRELAGIRVVTVDPAAAPSPPAMARRFRTRRARGGHTGAVAAAAQRLATEGFGLLALPGDIPLVRRADIRQLLAAHRGARAFTIVPAHDRRGSNAVLCTPAAAVPLRFGDDSFFPHLAAARACGIEPQVVDLPRIALDIDTPDDLAQLLEARPATPVHALLAQWNVVPAQGASK